MDQEKTEIKYGYFVAYQAIGNIFGNIQIWSDRKLNRWIDILDIKAFISEQLKSEGDKVEPKEIIILNLFELEGDRVEDNGPVK